MLPSPIPDLHEKSSTHRVNPTPTPTVSGSRHSTKYPILRVPSLSAGSFSCRRTSRSWGGHSGLPILFSFFRPIGVGVSTSPRGSRTQTHTLGSFGSRDPTPMVVKFRRNRVSSSMSGGPLETDRESRVRSRTGLFLGLGKDTGGGLGRSRGPLSRRRLGHARRPPTGRCDLTSLRLRRPPRPKRSERRAVRRR